LLHDPSPKMTVRNRGQVLFTGFRQESKFSFTDYF
jgi:hypothetical protein